MRVRWIFCINTFPQLCKGPQEAPSWAFVRSQRRWVHRSTVLGAPTTAESGGPRCQAGERISIWMTETRLHHFLQLKGRQVKWEGLNYFGEGVGWRQEKQGEHGIYFTSTCVQFFSLHCTTTNSKARASARKETWKGLYLITKRSPLKPWHCQLQIGLAFYLYKD